MRATAAGVVGTALAGCSGTREETFEASPVALAPAAGEFGYQFEDARAVETTREESGGGQTVRATVISHVAAYSHVDTDSDRPFLAEPSVGVVGTPAAEVLGQEINPAARQSLSELLRSDAGKRFLRSMEVDAEGWSQEPEELGSTGATMLDRETEAKTFVGVADNGDLVLVNAARVTVEGDVVLAGDARTRAFQGDGSPADAVDRGVREEARAGFVDEVAPYVVRESPQQLPGGSGDARVYDVVQNGLSREEAEALRSTLVERFGADPELFEFSGGVLSYLDEDDYKRVPDREVPADEVELEMPQEADDPPETFAAIDRAGIQELPEPPSQDGAASDLMSALESAGVDPRSRFQDQAAEDAGVTVSTRQPIIELLDTEGNTQVERPLDTVVDVKTSLGGAEVVGSGSKIHASFATVDGQRRLTEFRYAHPILGGGSEVELTPLEELSLGPGVESLQAGFEEELGWAEGSPELSGTQVYPVPLPNRSEENPVGEGSFRPRRLVPHYQVQGTVDAGGEAGEISMIGLIVPAVEDPELKPEVSIEAEVDGREVIGQATVDGGQPPYSVEWNAEHGVPGSGSGLNASVPLQPRESIDQTTVMAEVSDANGVGAVARTTVDAPLEGSGNGAIAPPGSDARSPRGAAAAGTGDRIGGVPDFGFEGSNWGVGFDNGYGFVEQMRQGPLNERFSFQGSLCWERDYRDPGPEGGSTAYDELYGDNADFQFYCGHGNPKLFSFKDSDHEKGYFPYWNGNQDWGDYDAEWIALYSCQVMKPDVPSSHPRGPCNNCDGKSVVNRWGDNFDGLHVLLGFQDLAVTWVGHHVFSTKFGRKLRNGMPIWKAWIHAIHEHEPNSDPRDGWIGRGRIIGPIGPNGVCDKNDHIWGKGSVGPDIPESDIRGWWIVRGG